MSNVDTKLPHISPEEWSSFLRYLESGVLAGIAALSLTDMGKGPFSREVEATFGFPAWLIPFFGIWQACIPLLNFAYGGSLASWAQYMLAALMGGCCFSHVRLAKRTKDSVSSLIFFACSIAVLAIDGHASLESAVLMGGASFGMGWVGGEILVLALNIKAPEQKPAPPKRRAPAETKKDK